MCVCSVSDFFFFTLVQDVYTTDEERTEMGKKL